MTDSVGYPLGAHIPALDDLPRHNSDGMGGMHLYIPWWLWDAKNKEFPRGYHVEISGGFHMPGHRLVPQRLPPARRLRQGFEGYHLQTLRRFG